MARKIQLTDGSSIRYPEEKDLQDILKKLSSDEIVGSTVIPKNAPESDKVKYNLCALIVKYKIENNINQKDLAEKLGLKEQQIQRYKVLKVVLK